MGGAITTSLDPPLWRGLAHSFEPRRIDWRPYRAVSEQELAGFAPSAIGPDRPLLGRLRHRLRQWAT